jgi:hypothetical protein
MYSNASAAITTMMNRIMPGGSGSA